MIEKITPTTAKSKNYSFCLVLYDDGGCYVKKQSVWNKTSAYLANEKLEKEWEETKILNWYYKNKDKFTQEEIIKIYNLLIK